ncbi:isoprenyl transferase [Alicyclobacillaceae bacterium I2511]|nr:isoprenyl transferase [Alicyclobacillaceae bacterium I2511]
MDGNGRWATRRGLPRIAGHRAGMNKVREAIRACDELGVQYLTLYAFSTENWKRPQDEVDYLMRLPEEFFRTEINELLKRGVQVRFVGDVTQLPTYTRETVVNTQRLTEGNTGMVVTFALNYGGRAEVIHAIHHYADQVKAGLATWEDLSEENFGRLLSTFPVPDPDLVIRTSGERRLSNFLIWQSVYSELWFTEVLWPDFTRTTLHEAIRDYQRRKRRFGGLK